MRVLPRSERYMPVANMSNPNPKRGIQIRLSTIVIISGHSPFDNKVSIVCPNQTYKMVPGIIPRNVARK